MASSPAEEEDDYMSMAILEPQSKVTESSIQRRARKQREARPTRIRSISQKLM